MSTGSQQQDLAGRTPPKPHLTLKLETRSASNYGADPDDSTYFCLECRARVTVSTTTGTEYGHSTDCEHSIAEVGE